MSNYCEQFEYYYIRYRYSRNKIVKSGITNNLYNRNHQYKTNEEELMPFIICIKIDKKYKIEKQLHDYYKVLGYHKYKFGSGKELFDKKIIPLVIPFLETNKYLYYRLNNDELNNLNYIIDISKLKRYIQTQIIPYDHQLDILKFITKFYEVNNIGKLIWPPGLGKTIMSILICKKLNARKILIGVPTRYLQDQFMNEILKIYPNELIVKINDDKIFSSLSLFDNDNVVFFITTYTSAYKLTDLHFDFKIGDEAHHLVGIDNNKGFKEFHKINANKTLYMTATEKILDSSDNKLIYSMNDEALFGELIDEKTVNYAIEHKKITDYSVLIISNSSNELNNIISALNITNIDLFVSAFTALKSIESYNDLTKLLMVCNTIANCEIIVLYLKLIIEKNIVNINSNDIYINALHSKIKNIDNETKIFKQSKLGIIVNVYIYGEGFDAPELNGVVICENMQSYNRIVQTTLRANRLDILQPNKKAYIILPRIECDNNFDNILAILYSLRNCDENIEQKIKLLNIKTYNGNCRVNNNNFTLQFDNTDEITKLKLKLINSKFLNSIHSYEQNEYNYIKQINKKLNIQSKFEYSSIEIKQKHEYYIDNPEFYFGSNKVWINWFDFLQIDASMFLQLKNEWKLFCRDYNITPNNYNEFIHIYPCLPPNPEDFYKDFTNLNSELNFWDKRR
jgi:predicted helicase